MTQRDEARQWQEYEFVTCLELFPAGAAAECHQPTRTLELTTLITNLSPLFADRTREDRLERASDFTLRTSRRS